MRRIALSKLSSCLKQFVLSMLVWMLALFHLISVPSPYLIFKLLVAALIEGWLLKEQGSCFRVREIIRMNYFESLWFSYSK